MKGGKKSIARKRKIEDEGEEEIIKKNILAVHTRSVRKIPRNFILIQK